MGNFVKHLLIILSILLLSSPVIGNSHKGETLYGWITSFSTLEWKTFGEKGTHPIYKGDVEHGRPNGVGVMTFPDGRKYVGENKDGFPNGQGTSTYPSGDKYIGEFEDGEYHGQGTFTFNDGAKYVGEFKDGIVWNGAVYNGNIKYKIVNGK